MDRDGFRSFFGAFPTAVAVVTTLDGAGEPRGFTCNALSAVSMDPPLLLVCVDRRSRTLPALAATGAFVVNVLAEGADEVAMAFAGKSPRKFDAVRWTPSLLAGGAPVLSGGCLGQAECVTVRSFDAGDHRILIGRMENVTTFPVRPLLYHNRAFSVFRPDEELAGAGH
ncbi:flavin reductase family protein [Streptomyces sp. NRRL F-5126]|uniref:flavin reductase family protein n=1 Tax=Streptomyces sp. NRRL F-5126 TaxID=1463857 RepID=UPI00055D3067|nr:flavin reductase family protein [Streptomyces sp. NRRL F-5126]